MASIFEELGALDRPFCPVTINMGGKEINALARMPSAEEQDTIDEFYNQDRARILESLITEQGGLPSELTRVKFLYNARPKSDLVTQMLGARTNEITARAYELMGVDATSEAQKMLAMTEEEQKAYSAEQMERLTEFTAQAKDLEKQDLEATDMDTLVDQLSNYNVNLKSIIQARKSLNSWSVYYSLYTDKDKDGNVIEPQRVFESAEQVRKAMQPDTIDKVVEAIREGFKETAMLPFKSPADPEPVKPSLSPSISVEATQTSGEPIATTPAS